MLRDVLASLPQLASTRFGACSQNAVPNDQAKRAALLALCGYEARVEAGLIEVNASAWIPALLPRAEPVVSYLRKQCVIMPPASPMDPDDARFDDVFR